MFLKPRFLGEYDYASGNTRQNLNKINTFDQQYPSNHNAFGLTDLFGYQNIKEERMNLDLTPAPGDSVSDGGGLALAPGFVDTHSHHDDGLSESPAAVAAVSQGVTTIVVGQDGGQHLPLAAWLIASRKGDWDQLLAATLVTVAVAIPTLLLSVSLEVFLFPRLIGVSL